MAALSLTFLGAAGTVTGSKYLVDLPGRRILVDAGMFQGEKEWREMNWADFPVPPSSIDEIVLTHAHADHCGYLPALVRDGFTGPIWTTYGTSKLASIVLMDAGHLQEKEAQYAQEGGYSKHDPALPLYTVADVEKTTPLFRVVPFDTDFDLGDGIAIRMTRAGHILGSASVTLSTPEGSVLFSGDLGRIDHPVLRPRGTPPGSPFVLIESTYGDREHPDAEGAEHEAMADAIRRTIARGGSVLLPAFAIDRTEIVLKALTELRAAGRIPRDVPIFVNSPMAVAALAVYREAEGGGELRDDIRPEDFFNLPNLREITDAEDSKALNHPDHPSIIISSSGMATGGRVLHHLEAMLPDQRNCVIFTGYQGVGTRGRTLLQGAKQMKFRGRYVPVKAEIIQDGEFSVHADASDLIDWLRDLSPKPETVFVTHGEEGSSEAFASKVRTELGLTVVVPRYKEKVTLVPHGTWAPLSPMAGAVAEAAVSAPVPAPRPVPHPPSVPHAPTPGGKLPTVRTVADTQADDMEQVAVILETAIGQVPFLPESQQAEVSELLHEVLGVVRGSSPDLGAVREGVNLALYAAAGAVETPGGQSIVALLAHVPKVLG
jgi:metallo-beta-lactamase family protein